MIHIERTYPAPDSIVVHADQEHREAHAHYQTSSKTFRHKVFSKQDVKEALQKLFNGKCAYCESNVMVTSAIDKEHFRPKASIKDKDLNIHITPGYYWLAADWDNLLLACAHCNRTGRHEDIDGTGFTSGKLDRFPLADEDSRYYYGGDFNAEEEVRLLINPCVDHPENWLVYEKEGALSPKTGIDDHDKNKVDKSVEIFGLMRSELVNKRHETSKNIMDIIEDLKYYYSKYMDDDTDKDSFDRMKTKFDRLNDFMKDSREYLGITRYLIKKELTELKNIIELLSTE